MNILFLTIFLTFAACASTVPKECESLKGRRRLQCVGQTAVEDQKAIKAKSQEEKKKHEKKEAPKKDKPSK